MPLRWRGFRTQSLAFLAPVIIGMAAGQGGCARDGSATDNGRQDSAGEVFADTRGDTVGDSFADVAGDAIGEIPDRDSDGDAADAVFDTFDATHVDTSADAPDAAPDAGDAAAPDHDDDVATWDSILDAPHPEDVLTDGSELDSDDADPTDAADAFLPIDVVGGDALTAGCGPAPADLPRPDCGHLISAPGVSHETCTVVPAGACHTFWMGAVPNELYTVPMHLEVPRHEVHLTAFAISKFPVTVAEYRACVQAGACADIPPDSCLADPASGTMAMTDPNLHNDARLQHPVNCVSYSDAESFCAWLGGALPTEARFEYASAGPMTDAAQIILFPWGSDTSSAGGHVPDTSECHANIYGGTAAGDPFVETSPVGFFDGGLHTRAQGGWIFGPAEYQTCDDTGPFGTRDMTHNILELMKDGPSDYDNWAPGMINPNPAPDCVGVTIRNTSWRYADIVHARVTNRHFICLKPEMLPDGVPYDRNVIRSNDIGFRCAFDIH